MTLYIVYNYHTGDLITYFREYLVALEYVESIDRGAEMLLINNIYFENKTAFENYIQSLQQLANNLTNFTI